VGCHGHQAVTRRCPFAVNVVDSEMTGPAFNAERQKVLTTIDHVYTALYTVELSFNLYANLTRSFVHFFYILDRFFWFVFVSCRWFNFVFFFRFGHWFKKFARSGWNWLDFIVVVLSLVEARFKCGPEPKRPYEQCECGRCLHSSMRSCRWVKRSLSI